jgi:hypothetical protein
MISKQTVTQLFRPALYVAAATGFSGIVGYVREGTVGGAVGLAVAAAVGVTLGILVFELWVRRGYIGYR